MSRQPLPRAWWWHAPSYDPRTQTTHHRGPKPIEEMLDDPLPSIATESSDDASRRPWYVRIVLRFLYWLARYNYG